MKGLRGYDIDKLWEAVKHGANSVHPQVSSTGRAGYELYNKLGYVPCDKLSQSVARTLEYAYDDWCIFTLGQALGRPSKEIKVYGQRAMNYRNVFDPSLNLMRGKDFFYVRGQQETLTLPELKEFIDRQRLRGADKLSTLWYDIQRFANKSKA